MRFLRSSVAILATALLTLASVAEASGSFRLKNGKVISAGMDKAEVTEMAGKPKSRSVERPTESPSNRKGYALEVWSYVLEGDVGGKHYVTVRFDGSKVQSVESKQAR